MSNADPSSIATVIPLVPRGRREAQGLSKGGAPGSARRRVWPQGDREWMASRSRPSSGTAQARAGRHAVARSRPRAQRPPLRLTRRGRIVVVLAGAGFALLISALTVGPPSVATDESSPTPAYRLVTVRPGQTLWTLATEAAPGADPRKTVRRIVELNGLPDHGLQAGQQIAVPIAG